MFNKFLVAIFSLFLLAGCETLMGDSDSSGTSGTGGVGTSGVSSSDIMPGTQEDLVANVGDRVFFGYDSSVLSSEAQSTLARQASWLQANPNLVIAVEGHCDERGTREYNLALGERRATAAKNYLVSLGVDRSRISTISYGKEHPEVLGSDEDAWSKNRRAVTVINQ